MKVALLGVGYWGSKLLPNLVSLLGSDQVVAVDPDPRRQAWALRHYPNLNVRSDPGALFADPDIEAVVIATPARAHAEHTRAALGAGKHVLVEKPLATSVLEAFALVELADRQKLVLMVGHTFLFSPRVQWISRRLATPGIGNIHYLTSSRLNLGMYRADANVIWDLAPHDFSIIMFLLGEIPCTVQANARSVTRSGIPDVAFIHLMFPSGVLASVAVSWLAPRKTRSLVVVGDESMIVYDDMEPDEPVKVYDKGVGLESTEDFGTHQFTYRHGDTVAPYIAAQEPIAEQLAHFLECAKSGERPVSDGRFGAQVVAALEAADRSWRESGQPVPLDFAALAPLAPVERTVPEGVSA